MTPNTPLSPHLALVAFQISSLFPIEPWPSLKFAESERHLVWCCFDHERKPGRSASPHDSIHDSPGLPFANLQNGRDTWPMMR